MSPTLNVIFTLLSLKLPALNENKECVYFVKLDEEEVTGEEDNL